MTFVWIAGASFIVGACLALGIIFGTFCGMTIASWWDGDDDASD